MAFNLFSLVPGIGEEYEHVVTYSLVAVGLVGAGVSATASMKKQGAAAVIPDPKLSLRGLFEMITEFIQGFVIFINNLVGVIPGMTPATEQINTTLAMGTFMFVTYNYLGFREHRHHYLKHFLGPLLWLAPLMVIIELISHIVRPLSLGLRLANVMGGDHTVVGIFTDLVPLILPIPFYLLGMFVCFVQAFVFTLLSMVYIALATAHDH
jgi:F-type H+-transporting ATPase subunit a